MCIRDSIEEREALHTFAPVVRNLIRKPFAKSQIRADSGREGIISALVLGRLLCPEIVTQHRVQVQRALQGFKLPSLSPVLSPGNEVLLQRCLLYTSRCV